MCIENYISDKFTILMMYNFLWYLILDWLCVTHELIDLLNASCTNFTVTCQNECVNKWPVIRRATAVYIDIARQCTVPTVLLLSCDVLIWQAPWYQISKKVIHLICWILNAEIEMYIHYCAWKIVFSRNISDPFLKSESRPCVVSNRLNMT